MLVSTILAEVLELNREWGEEAVMVFYDGLKDIS